nr:MmcB family DNA repair protein [Alsobacter ponti]
MPPDGRQSPTALAVARGTRRLLGGLGFATVTELPLASGRRADIVALAPDGAVWIVEVKSSVEDFRADAKWPDYRLHCDRLFFAIPQHVPADIMPDEAGLILADAYGAEILRHPGEHRLPAATRKALLLRFAHACAQRLHALADPEAVAGGF